MVSQLAIKASSTPEPFSSMLSSAMFSNTRLQQLEQGFLISGLVFKPQTRRDRCGVDERLDGNDVGPRLRNAWVSGG